MIRVCESCGQRNRVPAGHLADAGRCGRCKGTLPPLGEPIEVGPEEFAEITQGAKVPVLVDFWADWCAPCRMAAPHVKETARKMAGRALVLKVNTDANPELSRRYRVRGIPHFVVLRQGQVVHEQPGLVDQRQLQQWLQQAEEVRSAGP